MPFHRFASRLCRPFVVARYFSLHFRHSRLTWLFQSCFSHGTRSFRYNKSLASYIQKLMSSVLALGFWYLREDVHFVSNASHDFRRLIYYVFIKTGFRWRLKKILCSEMVALNKLRREDLAPNLPPREYLETSLRCPWAKSKSFGISDNSLKCLCEYRMIMIGGYYVTESLNTFDSYSFIRCLRCVEAESQV